MIVGAVLGAGRGAMRLAGLVNRRVALAGVLILALVLRAALRGYVMQDLEEWVIPWFNYLRYYGIQALGTPLPSSSGFGESQFGYTPPYHYLLYIATRFDLLFSTVSLIKTVSVVFDFVAAYFVVKIVSLSTGSAGRAWAAGSAVLLAPTLILNSAVWGQCDSIYASLLLGSCYYFLAERPLRAVVFLGVAISFKAQGVFLLPFVLLLTLQGRVPWRLLMAVPIIYTLMMMPAVILGRPLLDLYIAYYNQGQLFRSLSKNAPNLYYLISNTYYVPGVIAGIVATISASVLFAMLPRWKRVSLNREFLMLAATVAVALVPFLLPKMHDRYFLPADLMSIALAFIVPRLWFVPVGFQVASALAYVPAMSESLGGYDPAYTGLMPLAVVVTTMVVGALVIVYWRSVFRSPASGSLRGLPE